MRQPRYVVLMAIAVALAIGCISAGVWQVHRYDWKRSTNDVLRTNDKRQPEPVGQVLGTGAPAGKGVQFRRVTATGRYDAAHQLVVRQREVNSSPAFLVVTPLRTDAGAELVVVRGWMPMTQAANRTPRIPAPPAGPVTVHGRAYPSEPAKSTRGLPAGQIDRLNITELRDMLGTTVYGGYVELTDSEPRQSGLSAFPRPDMSNPAGGAFELQHLAYVVQWFIFAGIALAAPFILMRIERRREDGGPRHEIAAPVANNSRPV